MEPVEEIKTSIADDDPLLALICEVLMEQILNSGIDDQKLTV